MRRRFLVFGIISAIMLFAVRAYSAETTTKPAETKTATPVVTQKGPETFEQHLQKSRQSFLKKDMKNAAAEARMVEAFLLKKKGEVTADNARKAIDVATEDLKRLANDLEKGTVKEIERLDAVFQNARNALAGKSSVKPEKKATPAKKAAPAKKTQAKPAAPAKK